jgi:hypothetical protein
VVCEHIESALGVEPHVLEDELIEVIGEGVELRRGERIVFGPFLESDEPHHLFELHELEFFLLFAEDGVLYLLELLEPGGVVAHIGDGTGWSL